MTEAKLSATPSDFRKLMGNFASGVSVITATDGQGSVAGMTATAVTAVSLEPPLISVCVNHSDPLHVVMKRASRDNSQLSPHCDSTMFATRTVHTAFDY